MLKRDKERIVGELTERLRSSQTLILADYRGLSVSDFDQLRDRLLEAGARFSVVKNTLTRRAAQAAGTDALLEFLDGPTAIAFIQPDGDPVAVAKVLSDTARTGRVLVIKGGVLEGRPVAEAAVEELATLPPIDVLRGQVLGAVIAPLNAIVGLVSAPLQDLVGLIDARIEQLGGDDSAEIEDGSGRSAPPASEQVEGVQEVSAAAEETTTEPAATTTETEPSAVEADGGEEKEE
jgi:large subunit ribosomal protein L10